MTKSVPTAGQKQWGSVLNSHIAQLSDPTTGGINTGSSNPVGLVADDEGYTFMDTSTGQIKRYSGSGDSSDDANWLVQSSGGDNLIYEKSIVAADNADLDAAYQSKGATKIVFDDDSFVFNVTTQNYKVNILDGLVNILDEDGVTILATITRDKTTGAETVAYL